ncbi:MAG TPA: beta-eliminating lyase-related protein [Nocardioidaceae bacterium]|nr:beta-eliminating lyase-related protein [Nocardioidaceae bacterium]
MTPEERAVFEACERRVSGHRAQPSMRAWLEALSASPVAGSPPDAYGEGDALQELERQVAELLGLAGAVFSVKGVIAQQAALRVWTDRTHTPVVALHPLSHIDDDEESALEWLHRVDVVRLGERAPFTVEDLDSAGQPLGAVVVELPLRNAGFLLPAWESLVDISGWCRQRGVPLHLDGARLWESAPYYERSYAEIAALFDSVYVSLYKGLGAPAGCLLAGSDEFLAAVRPWLLRHGSSLFTAFPYVLGGLDGLQMHLPRMPEYVARARTLAAALGEVRGIRIVPDPPQTNGFQLLMPRNVDALKAAHLAAAAESSLWLSGGITATTVPDVAKLEVQVGNAADDVRDDDVAALAAEMLTRTG